MGRVWTSLALFLVFFSGIALIESASLYKCYSFNDTDDGWTHEYDFYWKWSHTGTPDTSNIPSFIPSSGYMWFQDQDTPPVSGAMRGPDVFTIDRGDKIQAKIFRHIIIGQNNDTDRPVLRFVTQNQGVNNVLYNYDYEWWSPVEITCNDTGSWETKTARCCQSYPCTGYFRVEGQVLIRDELLAIDEIGINGACDGGTPVTPTTPPPAPDNWCCTFNAADYCGWSPFFTTNGWIMSRVTPDPVIEAITSTEYIYIVHTSATATSSTMTLVPATSTFTFSYYFQSDAYDSYNKLQATFVTSTGFTTIIAASLPPTGNAFSTPSVTVGNLCAGYSTCEGTFHLTTSNSPSVELTAALRSFSLNGATC